MKNLQLTTLAILCYLFVSCGERRPESSDAEKQIDTLSTMVATGSTDIDSTNVLPPPPLTLVRGTVTNVQNGKDGYTATIKDDTGKLYYATISIPNLKDPKQYRTVKNGDLITVKGESWKSGEELHIKAEVLE